MSKYVFEGEAIKLNARDYARMQDLYSNLDLPKELEQLDFELREKKKWWPEMNAKLNYRNQVQIKRDGGIRKRTLRDDLEDRSWAN